MTVSELCKFGGNALHRVLVIDSDREFSDSLKAELEGRYSTEVELAPNGEAGMAAAKAQAPDIVVLAVELSDDNGFLVGRKLRRSKRLGHVPIIILSNDENADNLFAQHQKTKSKAEDYVRRPISAEDLVARIQAQIPLEPLSATDHEIEGEDEMSDDTRSDAPANGGEIDEEIDAFADDAFDALMMGGEDKPVEGAPAATDEPASDGPATGEYEDVELDDVIMVSDAPPEEVAKPSSMPPAAPPESMRPPPGENTGVVEVARLKSEISELKAKLAESSGGVSSRQFLDLRETLNSKDKEILDLRDQLTGKDKEIIELKDHSIELERARADFDEKTAGLERTLSKAQESIAGLTEDKEAANKRFEDVKARFEREQQKASGLEESLGEERKGRAADIEALKSAHDAELGKAAIAHEDALTLVKAEAAASVAKLEEDNAAALQAAQQDKETSLGTLRSELADEHSAALAQAAAEAAAAQAAAVATAREELETQAAAQVVEVETAWKRTLAEKEAELQGEKDLAVETLEADHSKQLATLGRKLADTETELGGAREREQLNAERGAELETKLTDVEASLATTTTQLTEAQETRDRLAGELTETKEARDGLRAELDASAGRVSTLEGEKRELESRVGSLEAVKSQLESKLSDAMQKIATDEAILERVRKAMAIGLTLLEEQSQNAVGGSSSEMDGVSEDAE
ncbi:MAG: response regulator [Myxococcota bacterium]